jgi:hypothetical protein
MSEIQDARDVLAKWRQGIGDKAWVRSEAQKALIDSVSLTLIVGTAGNPDLLDELDLVLSAGIKAQSEPNELVLLIAKRIAAAIIVADNRMRS